MTCPACAGRKLLDEVATRRGFLVERCSQCHGIWLDQGEIFFFTKHPQRVERMLEEALRHSSPGNRLSPKAGVPMQQIPLVPGRVVVDACPQTGGLWFDDGELRKLLEHDGTLASMEVDDPTLGNGLQAEDSRSDTDLAREKRDRLLAIAMRMTPLPDLVSRSLVTLVGLYALLTAVLVTASLFLRLPPAGAVGFGVLAVLIQFAVGPFLMDLTLGSFYRMSWVSRSELPDRLVGFIENTCAEHDMPFPSMGIIHDGSPNAFTYGHTPKNARVVLTQGLIDLLSPAELEAVVAHEIGHAKHWDMAITSVATLVPLILYYIYRVLIRMRGGRSKSAAARLAVAVGAYGLYIISEYVVLWLSRTREYHADRFSGSATKNPNSLASALVKIAYGLAGRDHRKGGKEAGGEDASRSRTLEGIGALGILDAGSAKALAVTSAPSGEGGDLDKALLADAMRWDLWNPWAKFYEIHSTHPLVANRLNYLGEQAASMKIEPLVVFDHRRPESYWDDFFLDLAFLCLPVLLAVPFLVVGSVTGSPGVLAGAVFGLGAGMLLKTLYVYRGRSFPAMNVASLLKYVKVSGVRPVPCRLRGTIVGKGVPGLIWSEDFVLRDATGILFLDYRQPLRIWEFIFGLLRGSEMQGQRVEVTGWYRRSPMPYLEIRTLETASTVSRAYVYLAKIVVSVMLILAGIYFMALD